MEKPNIIAAALAEEQQLLAELSELEREYQRQRAPLQRKLDATRAVKAAYGAQSELDLTAIRRDAPHEEGTQRKPPSHKAAVTATSREVLAEKGPLKTPVLLQELQARGLVFLAADPQANLSVILSKDPQFVSDRRIGWSLAQKNPQDAATSAGSLPT